MDTKEILRHSSEKTTEIYRNSKEQVRHDSIQRNKVGLTDIYSKGFEWQKSNYMKINIKDSLDKF